MLIASVVHWLKFLNALVLQDEIIFSNINNFDHNIHDLHN